MTSPSAVDLGVLLLRLLLAAVLFAHAAQKSLGWFSGSGLDAAAAGFEKMGHRPGRLMAAFAAGSELAAAVSIGSGALTPLGVAVGLGTMLVAGSSVTLSAEHVWNSKGGGEYPLFIGAVLAALVFLGPGELSLDTAFHAPWLGASDGARVLLGCATVAVGAASAVPLVLRCRHHLRPRRAADHGV